MALRHRSAEFKQEEVDAVRDVDGVLDNAIGGMKGRMKVTIMMTTIWALLLNQILCYLLYLPYEN